MNAVSVEVFFDFIVRDVVGDELDVLRNLVWSIFLALHDGELWPFRVFFPQVENGVCALEGTPTCEVKK